ncbi:MAG TPA: hypothetical protein VEP49_20500 [Acidimicrobiia bacterium]|nr:hypothetical protein [Acidimicrobiia bacterium]
MDTTIPVGALRFEACAEYRPSADDVPVCGCGWLEDDHGELAARRVIRAGRFRVARPAAVPARRAS